MKRFVTFCFALCALAMAGCAVSGGGPINPITSQFVPKSLDINAMVLLDNATLTCNASAADEYNFNMAVCASPQTFINQLPPIPFSTVTPAQEVAGVDLACATGSYLAPGMPANIVPGPVAACIATPAGQASANHFKH